MIRNQIADLVTQAIKNAQATGALPVFDPLAIEISRPKEAARGDFTSPAAMQSAKPARMAPLAIAQAIAAYLPAADFIAAVEVALQAFLFAGVQVGGGRLLLVLVGQTYTYLDDYSSSKLVYENILRQEPGFTYVRDELYPQLLKKMEEK